MSRPKRREAEEINREADRIERNRAAAPLASAFAGCLFDVAHQFGSDALEDVAVAVDADAQAGREYGEEDVRRTLSRIEPLIVAAFKKGKELEP